MTSLPSAKIFMSQLSLQFSSHESISHSYVKIKLRVAVPLVASTYLLRERDKLIIYQMFSCLAEWNFDRISQLC